MGFEVRGFGKGEAGASGYALIYLLSPLRFLALLD